MGFMVLFIKNFFVDIMDRLRYSLLIIISLIVMNAQAQSDHFRKEIEKSINELSVETPGDQYPVSVSPSLLKDSSSDFMAVIIKINIADGWHIYSIVPPIHHYVNTDFLLELPEGVEKVGDWIKPVSNESQEKGVYIYEKEAVFIHYIKIAANLERESYIETGLDFQCCNYSICKPPGTRLFKLIISP
jgi:hypothetical protein